MGNLFLEGVPQNVKEEIFLLYNLGVKIEDIEYLIKIKLRENFNLDV